MEPAAHELSKDHYIDTVRTNSAQLAGAARLGLQAPVPTCPGWYVASLVAHIGEVQRFWTHQIVNRAHESQDLPASAFDSCPGLREWFDLVEVGNPDLDTIPDGLIEWFERATDGLCAAFEAADPDERIWHWSGDNRAITHMRNQAIEATLHRWDAQNAHGVIALIDMATALDGIEQHFEVQIAAARRWGHPIQGSGETYHFHRTDGPGEWLVRFEGDEVTVHREHTKGDIAIRGTAENLFLWLAGRITMDRLEVHGDARLLSRYRELVPPN